MVILEVVVLLFLLSLIVGGLWLLVGAKMVAGKNRVRSYNDGYNDALAALSTELKRIKSRENEDIDRIANTLKL